MRWRHLIFERRVANDDLVQVKLPDLRLAHLQNAAQDVFVMLAKRCRITSKFVSRGCEGCKIIRLRRTLPRQNRAHRAGPRPVCGAWNIRVFTVFRGASMISATSAIDFS